MVQVWFPVCSGVISHVGVSSVDVILGTSVGSSTVDVGVGVVSGGVSCVHPAIRTMPAMQSPTIIKHIVLFIAAPPFALSCEYTPTPYYKNIFITQIRVMYHLLASLC